MKKKLSIIIPCYNCEFTLREAVKSCYKQGFLTNEFEIVMVDDSSTDGTYVLMENLAKEYKNIQIFQHEENQGGGAARNTGIRASNGDIIYCLDSDNFFAPNSVRPMLQMFDDSNIDGVVFEERRFFIGNKSNSYKTHKNKVLNRPIELLDLLSSSRTLLDNFFYTRKAFDQTKGYPEHHGFDTQCFEFRFIGSGFKTQVCPKSIFYHRQAGHGKSYFERVYESGAFSMNMYLIIEEYLFLFSAEAIEKIINFDIFSKAKLGNDITTFLTNSFQDKPEKILLSDYKKYCRPTGFSDFIKNSHDTSDWILGTYSYLSGEYTTALINFCTISKQYPNSRLLYFNSLRCLAGSANIQKSKQIDHILNITKSIKYHQQYIDLNPNILKKIAIAIKKLI